MLINVNKNNKLPDEDIKKTCHRVTAKKYYEKNGLLCHCKKPMQKKRVTVSLQKTNAKKPCHPDLRLLPQPCIKLHLKHVLVLKIDQMSCHGLLLFSLPM